MLVLSNGEERYQDRVVNYYLKLKKQLHTLDISYTYLAQVLHRSRAFVEKVMAGRLEFRINECWKILDLIQEKPSAFIEYFPPNGKEVIKKKTNKFKHYQRYPIDFIWLKKWHKLKPRTAS